MQHLLHRLCRDQSGAAIMETALAAPILATMVIGMVDLAGAYGKKLSLEQAAQRGIEKIMQTTDDDTVDTTVVDEIAATAGIPVSQVTLTARLYCTNRTSGVQNEIAFTSDCNPATEWESRYIEIVATDKYRGMFLTNFIGNAQGDYPIRVKVGMRTQ